MARKKKVDNTALIQMIKDDVPQNEIMAKLGFKTSTQLKVAYANALMETGNAPVLSTGRAKKAPKAPRFDRRRQQTWQSGNSKELSRTFRSQSWRCFRGP